MGSEVLCDGASHSPVLTQQRDMVGSEIIFPERIHAAVVMGMKTGSGAPRRIFSSGVN